MTSSEQSYVQIIDLCHNAAKHAGLEFFGLTSLNVEQEFQWFQDWLRESRHGSMTWLTNHLEVRRDPALLLEGSRSALIFGFPYFIGPKNGRSHPENKPEIAQYARLADYHKFMRKKLMEAQIHIGQAFPQARSWRITVDSAPLLERALASRTNNCFIGKNTCVIHPIKGSYFLLGELITNIDLQSFNMSRQPSHQQSKPIDPAKRTKNGGCGSCRRCQVHCPTGALDQDYRIDARKCLSYWTIEHRGTIPEEYWPWIGRYMFGCDICQNVCPYNRGVEVHHEAKKLERHHAYPDLNEIAHMSQQFYESKFGGTPMTRAKRTGLRRNAIIAGVVTGNAEVIASLKILENDEDEIIQETSRRASRYLQNGKITPKI